MSFSMVENELAQQNSRCFIQVKNSENGTDNMYTSDEFSQIRDTYSCTQ